MPPRATLVTDIHAAGPFPKRPVPLFLCRVEAGFPSPGDDYIEGVLDLNDLCVSDEAATFFVRASGHSMTGEGIRDGDLLVVNRAIEPTDGRIVIATLGGDLTVKKLRRQGGRLFLDPDSPDHRPIEVNMELHIFGVVTHVLHSFG